MNTNKLRDFESIFYPRSVAVVGASADNKKLGTGFLQALLQAKFRGKVYPVNRSGGTILGLQSYPKVSAIPDPVDYVIIAVLAEDVPAVVDDCRAKRVKVIQIFTAGFREAGTDRTRSLERSLVEKAKSGGFRIIGPNCIGICNPSINMPYGMIPLWAKPGSVAIVSQSGGVGAKVISAGTNRGLCFSKIVSFGNECDLESVDFLEYFNADPETKFIGAYLEGVRDGRRLFELLKEISRTKPIVVWKGGGTQAGARAAMSHTGSLASSHIIWSTVLNQVGAIEVKDFTEFIDTLLAFQQLRYFDGRNVSIVSGLTDGGGGDSVATADSCSRSGFNVPVFTTETIEQLEAILPSAGGIFHNPLDISPAQGRLELIQKSVELAAVDPNIDFLLIYEYVEEFDTLLSPDVATAINGFLIDLAKRCGKPIVVLLPPGIDELKRLAVEKRISSAGMLTYPSLERAVRALTNVSRFFRTRAERQ